MALLNQFHHYLRQQVWLTDSDWQAFIALGRLRDYAEGESVFLAGDTPQELRFIESGIACNYYLKADGSRRNKSFLQSPDVIACLSSSHAQLPTRFGCEALTELQCFEVPVKALQRLSQQRDSWRSVTELLITRLALKKEAREADLLLCSATELYQKFIQQSPELESCLANYQIASYLGITEVSLSRIRAKLGLQNRYQKQCD